MWPLIRSGGIMFILLIGVLVVCLGCGTGAGTGARTDPQTGTNTVGAQTARDQAGATYVIKSEGTVYNIDTDGAPKSSEAVKAIAQSLLAYDASIARLELAMEKPGSDTTALLDAIKWITAEKAEFMSEAKGAFGVYIQIRPEGAGHGSSTVDTAGTTGQNRTPSINEPIPPIR